MQKCSRVLSIIEVDVPHTGSWGSILLSKHLVTAALGAAGFLHLRDQLANLPHIAGGLTI